MAPKRGRAQPRFVGLGGGSRKRVRESDDRADAIISESIGSAELPGSLLFVLLISLWASGQLSPQVCQSIANTAEEDMKVLVEHNRMRVLENASCRFFGSIERLAEIGSFGKCTHNCFRDFMKVLPDMGLTAPRPTSFPFQSYCGSILSIHLANYYVTTCDVQPTFPSVQTAVQQICVPEQRCNSTLLA